MDDYWILSFENSLDLASVIGLTDLPWLKQPTMSISFSKRVNPHFKGDRVKTIKSEAAKYV